MDLVVIVGLTFSVFLSLMFLAATPFVRNTDSTDLAAAIEIGDEDLQKFIRYRITAAKLMRSFSYITTSCLLYFAYIQLWS